MVNFTDLGYFIEYYVNGKFYGTTLTDKPDRDTIGYYSKKDAIASSDIKLQNGKIIKRGAEYYTRLYPLNGRQV
tara:strand:- start:46 stop:267 length:222 start_codon:yes stop_codon:yes gene_type:complete